MIQYFADYKWFRGEPKGLSPVDDPSQKSTSGLLMLILACG